MMILGQLLIKRGAIDLHRWEQLTGEIIDPDDNLLTALASEVALSENELMNILSKELKVPFIELDCYIIDPAICRIIPTAIIFSQTILPLHRGKNFLSLAMADPANTQAIEDVEFMLGLKVKPILARSRDIKKISEEVFKEELITTKPVIDGWYDGNEEDEERHYIPEPTAESLAARLFNIVIQHIVSGEADCIQIIAKKLELDIIEIKNNSSSRIAPDHGPIKLDSPDIREVADLFISKFKIVSNLAISEELFPQEAGAIIKYNGNNHPLNITFSNAEDGDGILIDVRPDFHS